MRAVSIRAITTLMIALASLASASAQEFPPKPVRFIVPYAAGGSGDLLARLLGNKLSSMWGQQVVVDNRAGAGGLIGTEAAARSEPDGHTLYLGTDGPLTVAATLHKRVPYDWKRDFAPVSMMAMGYQVLMSGRRCRRATSPSWSRWRGSGRASSTMRRSGSAARPISAPSCSKSVAKVDIAHVPYRGSSAQAITALIAGDVSMFLVGTSTAVPHIQSGALRGLAVTASHRVDGLPDVPTFAEAGLPGVDVSLWFAVLVPGGTPAAIVKKLNTDIARVVADPEFKQALAVRGFEAKSSSAEQLAEFLDKDYVKFRDLIQKLGLQVE